MTRPRLKGLAGAAVLLFLSTHVASAGPDGTCEDYGNEDTVASEAPPSTPVPTAVADYTKIAQAAPTAVEMALPAKKSDAESKLADSLSKEHQSAEAPSASVFETSNY